MKKITFKPRENKHDNDCWCDAIALATNKQYDTIYKKFKEFREPYGTLDNRFTSGYLSINGYREFKDELTLYESLQLVNTENGVVMQLEHRDGTHLIYVKDKTIYDNVRDVEQVQYLLDHMVISIYIKIDDTFKLIGGSK